MRCARWPSTCRAGERARDRSPATWARMFRAAAAMYRARPWDVIPPDAWIEVDCELLGITGGALTVVGPARQSHGFVLCRTAEDALAWLTRRAARTRRGGRVSSAVLHVRIRPRERGRSRRRRGGEAAPLGARRPGCVSSADRPRCERPTAGCPAPRSSTVSPRSSRRSMRSSHDEPALGDAWDGDPIEWEGGSAGARVRLQAPFELEPARTWPGATSLMTRLARREHIPTRCCCCRDARRVRPRVSRRDVRAD